MAGRPQTAVILGIGHWHAAWHVEALRADGVTITAIWDPDQQAAERQGDRLRLPVVDTLDRALARRPDLAIVGLPPATAPAILHRVIDAAIPLLTEKPVGLTAAEVAPVADHAEAAGSFAGVLFVNRLSPVWSTLGDGESGDIVTAAFRINNGPPERYLESGVGWVLDPARGGGGALRNLGIHGADAVLTLAAGGSSDAESAGTLQVTSASAQYSPGCAVETHLVATVRAAAGWTAVIEAGYNLPDPHGSDSVWRVGTTTRYLVDDMSRLIDVTAAGTTVRPSRTSAQRYRDFLRLSLDRIAADRPPLASLRDCQRAAELVDRIYALSHPPTTAPGVDPP